MKTETRIRFPFVISDCRNGCGASRRTTFTLAIRAVLFGLVLFNLTGRLLAQPQGTNPISSSVQTNLISTNRNSASEKSSNGIDALTMDTLDDKHTLALNDHLSFRIIQDDEPTKNFVVSDSGDIEIPLIGRYPVLGLTAKKLAWALKTELEKDYYYHATIIISVDVMSRTRGRVYLVGAVHAPGPQEIPSDEEFTLYKAI